MIGWTSLLYGNINCCPNRNFLNWKNTPRKCKTLIFTLSICWRKFNSQSRWNLKYLKSFIWVSIKKHLTGLFAVFFWSNRGSWSWFCWHLVLICSFLTNHLLQAKPIDVREQYNLCCLWISERCHLNQNISVLKKVCFDVLIAIVKVGF